jgi:LPS sulfotransferase NodH
MKSILIATTPRTGSWLLCGGLRQTGVAGRTDEYGGREDRLTWNAYLGFASHAEYFVQLPVLLSTANDVRSLKLMWPQFVQFEHDARLNGLPGASGLDLLQQVLGPYVVVFLRRRDVLRQAVSWVRAMQSGEWSIAERSQPRATPVYCEVAITQTIRRIHAENALWDRTLRCSELVVLTLDYEDMCSDFPGAVRSVASYAGIDIPVGRRLTPQLLRQADDVTELWMQRARLALAQAGIRD